jgi:hypothetical protein
MHNECHKFNKSNQVVHPFVVAGAVLLAGLACRPVLTIGWQEIGILFLLLVVLVGPALYRLARRWEEFRAWRGQKDKRPPSD